MYDIVRTVDATEEPVTLQQAKAHCRVVNDVDDPLLDLYITAARQYCEKVTGRAFLSQTWRLSLDHFPSWGFHRPGITGERRLGMSFYGGPSWWVPEILLPRPSLLSVVSLTYLDLTATRQTIDPACYMVDLDAQPARLMPNVGQYWPFALNVRGSVQVTFTAGYGTDPSDVPATLQLAILQLVAHWYENRESTVLPTSGTGIVGVPMGLAELLDAETFTAFTFES